MSTCDAVIWIAHVTASSLIFDTLCMISDKTNAVTPGINIIAAQVLYLPVRQSVPGWPRSQKLKKCLRGVVVMMKVSWENERHIPNSRFLGFHRCHRGEAGAPEEDLRTARKCIW